MMFGLFKRTKIADWEIALLKNTIRLLPAVYNYLQAQIDDGLFRSVLINASDLPGYVALTFNADVIKKFEKKKEKGFTLTGIKIYDKRSQTYLDYSIHIFSNLIIGYSITGAKKFTVDVSNIDVTNFRKKYPTNADYNKIKPYLSAQENKLINPDEVYEVVLNKKVYFHIKDLEDGDFIGIDDEKNIYEITHDPFEIKLLDKSLSEIMG